MKEPNSNGCYSCSVFNPALKHTYITLTKFYGVLHCIQRLS